LKRRKFVFSVFAAVFYPIIILHFPPKIKKKKRKKAVSVFSAPTRQNSLLLHEKPEM